MGSLKFILRLGKNVKKPRSKGKKKGSNKGYEKETPIYLQYVHDDQKTLIATGYKCKPSKWDTEQGKPKKDSEFEQKLDEFKREVRNNAQFAIVGEPTAYKVKEKWTEYLKEKKNNVPEAIFKGSILQKWNDYIVYLSETLYKNKPRTKGTIRNNENSREHLKGYLEGKKQLQLRPEKFTIQDYQKFEAYLVKELVPNSVSKVKKHFKSFLRWHLNSGGATGFNIALIEYSETPGIKIALTEKELTSIAHEDFGDRLNLVRDLIVLQASTGVRISDLTRLCDNILEDKSAFKIKTKKKGKNVLVPILPLAKEALSRRKYSFPYIPEQTYREGIKEIYKKLWPSKTIEIGEGDSLRRVAVWEEISSHDMVRTFVNIASSKGISVPSIAIITGKSIPVLLKNYLNDDPDRAAKELVEKFDISPLRVAK